MVTQVQLSPVGAASFNVGGPNLRHGNSLGFLLGLLRLCLGLGLLFLLPFLFGGVDAFVNQHSQAAGFGAGLLNRKRAAIPC